MRRLHRFHICARRHPCFNLLLLRSHLQWSHLRVHGVHGNNKPRLLFMPQQLRNVLGCRRVGLLLVSVGLVFLLEYMHYLPDGL